MLINKSRYQISKDRKLMRKVGKQWVVVSAFVLALLGAKGAKTMIHANSTESPDQQVTNQINQRLQQSQKLVKQQNGSQSASVQNNNVQNNQSHSVTQPTANLSNHNIMQAASNLHAQVIAHNIMNPQSVTDQSRSPQANHNQTVQKPEQNNLGMTHNLGGADNVKTGTYDGLTYKYDTTTQSLEFTGGTINASDTLDFLNNPQFGGNNSSDNYNNHNDYDSYNYEFNDDNFYNSDISNLNHFNSDNSSFYQNMVLKSVKFDSDVDFSHVNNMHGMFEYDWALQSIILPSNINTSHVTDMQGMFKHDSSLSNLSLPNNFNIGNVTNMNEMFKGDSDLKSLNIPSFFHTNHVSDMGRMFEDDTSLSDTALNYILSQLNVNYVHNMSDMFYNDTGLSSMYTLKIPNSFNTSKVNSMCQMFYNDGLSDASVANILNTLKTSNVRDMSGMFENNSVVVNITIPTTFDIHNVTNMSRMFDNDSSLVKLVIPATFNTKNVNDMSLMFKQTGFSDNAMEYVLSHLNVSNVTNMNGMLESDNNLHSLVVPSTFNTRSVKETGGQKYSNDLDVLSDSAYGMFKSDSNLTSLTLPSSFNVSHVSDMSDMFENDNALKTLNLPSSFGPDVSSSMSELLKGDGSLSDNEMETILEHLNTNHVTNMNGMLESDTGLRSLSIPSTFNTYNVTKTGGVPSYSSSLDNSDSVHDGMFKNDTKLQTLTLQNSFNMNNNSDMSDMFESDSSLKTLNLPNNFGPIVEGNMSRMFSGDDSLSDSEMETILSHLNIRNVRNLSDMLSYDNNLKSLVIPNNFNTSRVKNMNGLFRDDNNLRSLTLPVTFNTREAYDMTNMFYDDLKTLIIQSPKTRFGYKSRINRPYPMAWAQSPRHYQRQLEETVYDDTHFDPDTDDYVPASRYDDFMHTESPSDFITDAYHAYNSKVDHNNHEARRKHQPIGNFMTPIDIYGLLHAHKDIDNYQLVNQDLNNALSDITPKSYQLIMSVFNSNISIRPWYKKLNQNNYTDPHDDLLSYNNHQGTFVANSPSIPTETINYTYNGKTVTTQKLSDSRYYDKSRQLYDLGENLDITQAPFGYQLDQPNNIIKVDNGTHQIGVQPSPATDIINYQYDDHTVASNKFHGLYGFDLTINNTNDAGIPTNYQLINPNQTFKYEDGSDIVPVKPDTATDDVNYEYNGQSVGHQTFSGSDVKVHGADFTSFLMNNVEVPIGYHLANSDQVINYDGHTYNVQVLPNKDTANISYVTANNEIISNGIISGVAGSVIDPTKQVPVPKGYHTIKSNNDYRFTSVDPNNLSNNPNDFIKVQSNQIKGTATIHLVYKRTNGKVDMEKSVQIPISGQVDGKELMINPNKYAQKNYTNVSQWWVIPMDSSAAPNGDNLNYHPEHTFVYMGTEADTDLAYVNVSPNGQVVPWVEDINTGSDYSPYNNGSMKYNQNNYPIVGHQFISDVSVAGQSVNFTKQGTKIGTNNMIAPKGYHFVSNNSNDRTTTAHKINTDITKPTVHNKHHNFVEKGTVNITRTPATYNNWIYYNGQYLGSDQVHDWQNYSDNESDGPSDTINIDYRYSPSTRAAEITKISLSNGVSDSDEMGLFTESDLYSDSSPSNTNPIGRAKSWKFMPQVANTLNKFGTLSDEISSNSDLTTLVLPANFHPISSDMSGMFSGNENLTTVILPDRDFTDHATNIERMFANDPSLTTLMIPSSFNTSNVNMMNAMFMNDRGLSKLVLPSDFDTRNVNSMTGMFAMRTPGPGRRHISSIPLQSITIQSPNTRFSSKAFLPVMYKNDSSIPNDFSQGNVGVFTSVKGHSIGLGLSNPLSNRRVLGNTVDSDSNVGTMNVTGTTATYTNWIYNNGKYLRSDQITDWEYRTGTLPFVRSKYQYKYSPSTNAMEIMKLDVPARIRPRNRELYNVTNNTSYVSIKLSPRVICRNTNMRLMFFRNHNLRSLVLPATFNTTQITNMEGIFASNLYLQTLVLPDSFTTVNANISAMFANDDSLRMIVLPKGFITHPNFSMAHMFSTYHHSYLRYLVIQSPRTKFSSYSMLYGGKWHRLHHSSDAVQLTDGKSHVGIWYNPKAPYFPFPSDNNTQNNNVLTATKDTFGIPVAGNQETLPVKFVDQNNHQISSDVNESGVMGTYIKLPTSVPHGYTLDPNQPTQELAVSNEMDPKDPSKLLPVTLRVTGNHVGVQVQYRLPNGQNVGNVFTIPSRQVGTTVDLTQLGLPMNYTLVSDHGDPTRYQLDVSDLVAPGYSQTKVLPVYIAPVSQNLTINYVDPDHDTFLTSRTVPVTSDTRVYLNNNDITNDNGNNVNSFVDQNDRVKGYQVESGQNLSPTVHLNASSNSYPIYTVKMQSRPVILHVTYWSSDANSKVGSDNITQNNHGQSSLLGDTMTLPTVANANAHGLVQGYTLDNGQPLTYQAHNVDTVNNGHVIDDVTLLAHGNKVTDQVPVTVDEVDGNGKLQRQDVIDVPVHGNVGDQITFNSSDLQDYIPQGYVMANANNSYDHTNYADHNYTAKLTASDAGQNRWNPASWQIDHSSNYWDATNQRPRFVIQATNQKQITVNFINQDRNKVGSTSFYGSYRDAIDLQNPLTDDQSALNDKLPAGYVYGSNNPSSLTYGQVARTVNINVTGRPTTIKVDYDDSVGHQLINSVDDIDDTHRIGDTVTLPTTHLPKGYVLVSPNDLSYTIAPNSGTVICHLNVMAHTETLPVKFINQNGKVIGNVNDQTQGVIGQNNVALPEAPQGYHYDQSKVNNGNAYNFTADQLDDNHPGFMQQHIVYLQGDTEAVPVEFINQDGKIVPNGSVTKVARIGDQITLPNAPSNYTVDSGQAAQYLLTTNNVNTPGHMKPVKIYVRTNQKYQFNVIAKEKVNGTLIGSVTTPIIVNSSDDKSHTYQPGDYQPSGFTSESGDHPVSTTVTDSGLSTPSVAWIYDAKNSENTTKPDDHQDPQPILVTYHDTDNDHDVMTNHRVDGFMNSQLDVTNPADGGVAVPNGYALNADQSLIHQITTNQQAVTLDVHGVHTGVNEFNLNVVREHHDGTTLMTPQSIVEGGNVNTSFQIKPSDYVPSGYHLDTATAHHKANEIVNGTVTADGLSPRSHTFYYAASQVGRDGVKPLVVTYYDDRTGAKVGTHIVNDGYMDQSYDVGQLGTDGLKSGYSVDANQNQTYTIGTQPITAHVMVHGNASTNREHDDTVTVQIYKEDPYGHSLSGQPETAYDVITGNVGDSYVVSANDYLPSGYQIDPSKNGDRSLTGTIQSDGSVDHRAVKFYYTMSNQDEDNLQPIHVMYENDLDSDVIADEVISPSKRNDDYVGKFVDVIPTKSNQNADNQQSPVPQGYVVDPKQDTLAGFSNVRPTYIDVLVHNDSNYQYHDQFNQLENFYDGDRLVDTADILKPITGVDGQRFTVNAPQTSAGYTAAVNNPGVITGYVKGHQLTMDNASYRFNATNSKNYDHPSDHDHAQPILVTFKDGNVTIGQPNQRVDGYMNQTVNVLDHLKVPVDYQTVGGDQFNYLITTNEQRLTIQVIPKVAQNAVANYEDQDSDHVVAQRAIVAPVGTRLTSLADEYTSLMPYGYGYAGHNSWDDDTRVTDNGQYVVYVTRMDVRARPIVTDNANDGRISVNYENQDGDVIGTYTLNRTDGTPFKLSDYTKSRSSNGQMPDGFTSPQVVSGESIAKFDKNHLQALTIKVNTNNQLATAKVEYEDVKTHQLIDRTGTNQPLSLTVNGHAGNVINYDSYQRFVPQGYSYYGMGNHDSVIEDGDVDVIMVHKDKPSNNYVGKINVIYQDADTGSDIDNVSVSGLINSPLSLDYYENDLPLGGYEFAGVNGASQGSIKFNGPMQNVTIKVRKPKIQAKSQYGSIKIHFVKADAEGISSMVNGNQRTSNQTLQSYQVPYSYDEVMTGHIGDLFNPEEYEHNTPQGTTFDHIVKGCNVNAITDQPQDVWIAVQSTNGKF